jgi:hypothetical protein
MIHSMDERDKPRHVASDIRLGWAVPAWEREPPQHLAQLLERFRIPGVSIAVVAGGALAWAYAWGAAQAGRPGPVTEHTLFQAGSISKPVAAVCALRLFAQGHLDLDSDVNQVLVSWKVPANAGWQPRVTVRQLLSHTAGLTVHGFPGYRADRPAPSLIQVLNGQGNTAPVRVATLPGLQFSYSGGGYCVLQQLLIDSSHGSWCSTRSEWPTAAISSRCPSIAGRRRHMATVSVVRRWLGAGMPIPRWPPPGCGQPPRTWPGSPRRSNRPEPARPERSCRQH